MLPANVRRATTTCLFFSPSTFLRAFSSTRKKSTHIKLVTSSRASEKEAGPCRRESVFLYSKTPTHRNAPMIPNHPIHQIHSKTPLRDFISRPAAPSHVHILRVGFAAVPNI